MLGGRAAGSPAALDGIAYVAQDTPLYKNLSVADMIYVTRNLNRRFDQPYAQARLDELGIPPKRKAGKLSGGQQAQTFFQCLSQHGYTLWTSYRPASRFWPFQWIEDGWLLALSALLIAVTVWLVRRRTA